MLLSSAQLLAIVLAVSLVVVIGVLYVIARGRSSEVRTGGMDLVREDIVAGLLAELETQRQETAYWRTAAQRVQRELDGDRGPRSTSGKEEDE